MNKEVEAYEGELRALREYVKNCQHDTDDMRRRHNDECYEIIRAKDAEQVDLRRHIEALTEQLVKCAALQANPPIFVSDVKFISVFKPFVQKFVEMMIGTSYGSDIDDLVDEARALLRTHPNAL